MNGLLFWLSCQDLFITFRYDGSAAIDLPWVSGSPDGGSMVYVLSNLTVTGIDPSSGPLVCKSAATHVVYDPMAKFI